MNEEKGTWAEEIFLSMEGSKRSKPHPGLLANIERQIEHQIDLSNRKIVQRLPWRYTAVAAILILTLNTAALIYYQRQKSMNHDRVAVQDTYDRPLISSYQIYE